MDTKAVQSHGHNYDQHHQPHNVGLQQGGHGMEEHNHDHEKKSVLKKVKAKAKKIKDTITKHGHHDHDQEHGPEYHREGHHIPDEHDLDQEDDEDEEMVQDPEIHGAPIYDSTAVTSAANRPGQVKTSERPRVNFGGANVVGEKPHHEPRVVVVSPSTEINQSRSTGPARTFVEAGRVEQPNVNLVRPMDLEADPHAPGNRHPAYASANYQTKVTDPTGAGGAEININPVQKSLERMTIHNEPKPIPEPKILPTIAETQSPAVGGNKQFVPGLSTPTKTHYPSAETHGQNLPELSGEIKTHYPRSHDQVMPNPISQPKILPTQHPSTGGSHQQFMPEVSSITKTHYPSAESHGHILPGLSSEITTHYPKSHDEVMPDLTPSIKTHEPYPSAIRHAQNPTGVSSATKTHYPSTGSHDQFSPELPISSEPKPQYSSARTHDQFNPQHSSATETHYPYAGSHGQFDLPTEHKPQHPSSRINDQFMPSQHASATDTHYPYAGSHGQFAPEFSTQMKTGQTLNNPTLPKVEEQPQPHSESMEQQSNQTSYTDKISSATSAVTNTAIGAKNAVANTAIGAKNAVTDTAIGAKNAVTDTAIGAKNVVAATLGYGEKGGETDQNESNQGSYTEKISSATSAIADKAIGAKNTVASKLGFGESSESGENALRTQKEEKNEGFSSTTATGSAAEYGKRIAESLTEKLAPVYGKVTGSGVKSEVSESGVVEQDKGVSVKDYLAEKVRPGEDDRALSEVISETLHMKGDEEGGVVVEEERDVRRVVSDAVHKRGDESEGRRRVPLGKVTESEEVKRRLGGEDRETERRYEESYVNSPGEGVVDKVKGMVGSWFTKPVDNQSSSQGDEVLSRKSGAEDKQFNQATGERRLQWSSN